MRIRSPERMSHTRFPFTHYGGIGRVERGCKLIGGLYAHRCAGMLQPQPDGDHLHRAAFLGVPRGTGSEAQRALQSRK